MANLLPYTVSRRGSSETIKPSTRTYQYGDGYRQVYQTSSTDIVDAQFTLVLSRADAKALRSWLNDNIVFLLPDPLDTAVFQQWEYVQLACDLSTQIVECQLTARSIKGTY